MTQNMINEIVRKSRTVAQVIGALMLLVLAGGNASAQVQIGGSVFGGGNLANVGGNVEVNMCAGTVTGSVYGGGAKANTNTNNWDATANEGAGGWASGQTSAFNTTTVNLLGGTVSGNAFGGGLGQKGYGTIGTTGYKEDIPAYVYGDVKVNLNGLEAETDINETLRNSLTSLTSLDAGETGYKRVKTTGVKGAVVTRVFGCNDMNGTPKGHVKVNVYATQKSDKTAITPKNSLHKEGDQFVMETTSPTTYDVAAVYGGGNLAPYEPVDAYSEVTATKGAARSEVYIYGCTYTSIKQVYGGGNAASSPATYVRVYGAYEIEELFGGGNGLDKYSLEENGETVWYANPGANVGYKNCTSVVKDGDDGYDATIHGDGDEGTPYLAIDNNNAKSKEGRQTPANGYMYGSGVAKVEVFGGTIHASYGGSNTRGNVCTEAFSKYEKVEGGCPLDVKETYGGGKDSDIDGKITLDLGCTTYMPTIYGGSKNADVFNNIELNITNGKYDKVFGGNNTSGNIHGDIIVNIEEQGCVPIEITELYLGGDQADYSIYGYDANGVITKEDYDGMTSAQQAAITVRNQPRLNIISASHIGNVYGGGYKAVVVGNPHVNVNMEPGKVEVDRKEIAEGDKDSYDYEFSKTEESVTKWYVYVDGNGKDYNVNDETKITIGGTDYAPLSLGTIGNIFGGGNQANIVGNTYVEIGTGKWLKKGTDDVWETKDAAGNTYTFEKKGSDTAPRWYLGDTPQESAPTPARKAANITGDVFGGGNGLADDVNSALVEGNTNIEMAYGEVKQSVYGGGNLAQVGGDTNITVTGGTIGTPKEGTNVYGGAKYGNVYGGGKGNTTNAQSGLIKGDTYVNISGTSTNILHNVYGGGAYGSVGEFTFTTGVPSARAAGGTTNVTITDGIIGTDGHENGMVFGSSRGDVDTPAGTPAVDPNDKLAWVYDAKVTIGTSGATTGPQINGSVYGSGENGHTYHDTDVKVYSGTIGIDGTTDVTIYDLVSSGTEYVLTESTTEIFNGKPYNYRYRGNVYGGGCGTDTYPGTTTYNPLAGVVYGTANVTIAGGLVVHNVYGAGAMGSVGSVGTTDTDGIFTNGGTTAITISGGTVGVDGSDGGNVYGAARGDLETTQTGLAQVKTTGVTISSGTVYGNVYGGGEAGLVQSSTSVSMSDGTVGKNVYGGGMMGDVGIINKTDRSNPAWPAGTGACSVVISGGTVGSATSSTANHASGHVFGAGEGTATETSFYCDNAMAYNTSVTISNGTIYGNVYGGGEVARVETDTEVQIGQSQEAVANTIYYQKNTDDSYTAVDKAVGENVAGLYTRSGESEPYVYTRIVASEPTVYGSVFGAGAGKETHGYSALVRHDSKVTIEGDAKVKQNVYGGGEIATVGRYKVAQKGDLTEAFRAAHPGIEVGMPYETTSGGTCTVIIRGDAVIGADGASETAGHVFGAGKGVGSDIYGAWAYTQDNTSTMPWRITPAPDPEDMPTYKDDVGGGLIKEYYPSRTAYYKLLETLALATTTDVTISGRATVKGTVYGGSESGFVQGDTEVKVENGEIGTTGTTTYGNIFGGGKGLNTFAEAGRVKGSTEVAISGGITNGNVYGGGELGDVGTIDKTDINNYIWKGSGDEDLDNDTGVSTVTVSGTSTQVKGNVFGAGRGSGVTFQCEKAMVYRTIVSVENGTVGGNVYGGGEIGRVENNTQVKIGVKPEGGSGTYTPDIKGSVFGGGMGLKTHGYSALVRGNTEVTVEGDTNAKVEGSVYGGGQIASVGRYGLDAKKMPEILLEGGYCTVTVRGKVQVGPEDASDDEGNVFGAGKGIDTPYNNTVGNDNRSKRMVTYAPTRQNKPHDVDSKGTLWDPYDDPDNPYDDPTHPDFVWEYFTGDATTTGEDEYKTYLKTLALATHPNVIIAGSATVNGSVFGGGELGLTKGSVFVNILGGTIAKDVYGGGSLADTNTTDRHGYKDNTGNWATDENGNYAYTTGSPTTTVNLLGGKLHDAYGGALGKANSTIDATDGVPAYVHGNVKVNLNGLQSADDMDATTLSLINTLVDAETGYKKVKSDAKGAIVNRVFGCNNLNGSPKRQVKVYVYATQSNDPAKGTVSSGKTASNLNSGVYDVAAVYGGGNLAPYDPIDAYSDDTATQEAARSEVYIDGCFQTSIKQVYGGGNAASVPATYVEVNRVYEIDELFGGGNGADPYTLNNKNYTNPGANVGYKNYMTHSGDGSSENPYTWTELTAADTKAKRTAPGFTYSYGSGIAELLVKGGTIHTSYGGSNKRGNIRVAANSSYSAMFDDCPMHVDQSFGGGKDADIDGKVNMLADCAKGIQRMFGGSKNADVDDDINLKITNGSSLRQVFGGNDTSGAINGTITVTIEEGGCEPIRIGELYLGGYLAPYSVYGYETNPDGSYKTTNKDKDGNLIKDENDNVVYERIPKTSGSNPHRDPRIYVISATSIGEIYGGGYKATVVGNPYINVNMTEGKVVLTRTLKDGTTDQYIYTDAEGTKYTTDQTQVGVGTVYTTAITAVPDPDNPTDPTKTTYVATLPIGTIGNIYGGGNEADIIGDTHVEIGTGKWVRLNDAGTALIEETLNRKTAKISGDVYGGGNLADVGRYHMEPDPNDANKLIEVFNGKDADNNPDVVGNTHVDIGTKYGENESADAPFVTIGGNVYGGGNGSDATFRCEKAMVTGQTFVNIYNGTIGDGTDGKGNVYGGGKLGRVEGDTEVTIGLTNLGAGESAPIIRGNVFGAGAGKNTHGYSALVRGDSKVTVQGDAKVRKSVYGGGEVATVGKYIVVGDLPTTPNGGGICTVTIKDNAEIGPVGNMVMSNTTTGKPDDYGHVFGAGKGTLPYQDVTGTPWSMKNDNTHHEYTTEGDDYYTYINTLGLAKETHVTITGNALVKGSVYGGSENGYVQGDTYVTIAGGQIGVGKNANGQRHPATVWADDYTPTTDLECDSWPYVSPYLPYDPNAGADGKYEGGIESYARPTGSDGHTFYGNVFGGGSGYYPYKPGKWFNYPNHFSAGQVKGNTYLTITGGHILTNVYGGNEMTDVGTYNTDGSLTLTSGGTCYVTMTGGTIGVPRTKEQAEAHPVICSLYGAGKGDQRIFFNTKTNIGKAVVHISDDARIYGSVFGGGEDGHIIGDAEVNIGNSTLPAVYTSNATLAAMNLQVTGTKQEGAYPYIGTTGTSGVDGNVFGGGRGFSETALTAGVVGGNVRLNIYGGKMLGSVFGGGRMASVGTFFANASNPNYGEMQDGDDHGNIFVNIYNGTIGATGTDGKVKASDYTIGDVFAGCKGTASDPRFGMAKNTTLTITGGTINRNVYGGGEMGSVGKITNFADRDKQESGKYLYRHDFPEKAGDGALYSFGLSWPYEFIYDNTTGLATIDISGAAVVKGHIFGASKGKIDVGENDITKQRFKEALFANVRETQITIGKADVADKPIIGGSVYGGGEDGHVYDDTQIIIHNGKIAHSVFGGGKGDGKFTTTLWDPESEGNPKTTSEAVHSWIAGKVFGNTSITMNGGSVGYNIYGGGNLASVGKGNYAGGNDDYSLVGYGELPPVDNQALWTSTANTDFAYKFMHSGKATVTINAGKVGVNESGAYSGKDENDLTYGNVFGSSRGTAAIDVGRLSPRFKYVPDFFLGYVNETEVTIGDASGGPTIYGSIYGGGQDGHVRRSTKVTINKGTIGAGTGLTAEQMKEVGNVFGAGSGIGKNSEGQLNNSSGSVTCTTTVNIKGSTSETIIKGSVYGGGAMGSVGPPNTGPMTGLGFDEYNTTDDYVRPTTPVDFSSYKKHGSMSYTQVNIEGGNISGNVYGSSRGDAALEAQYPHTYATNLWSDVNISDGWIEGDVFGGGESGNVKCGVDVEISGGLMKKDVYGGGALARTNTSNWTYNSTTKNWGTTWDAANYTAPTADAQAVTKYKTNVTLKGGTIDGDVYGGGLGDASTKALVYGDVLVKLNENGTATGGDNCVVKGNIFGCNNLNGSPQNAVTVHIYKTQGWDDNHQKSTAKDGSTFDLAAVYGGGNKAAYEPVNGQKTASDTEKAQAYTHVIIDGCDLTSIKQVYGGGNAASAAATKVTVNKTYEINELFGGGNGYGEGNPGANVGYEAYPASYDPPASSPEERTANYGYGSGVASVNIFGGRIHNVFGGSNTKGNVRQTAVTILDSKDADCPLLIDEVYGGGKSAPMDAEAVLLMQCIPGLKVAYGGAQDADIQNDVVLNITNGTFDRIFGGNNVSGTIRGTITVNIEETGCNPVIIGQLYGGGNQAPYEAPAGKPGPTINAKSFTSIGEVFGGGYGQTALVKGDTHVNINVSEGKYASTAYDGNPDKVITFNEYRRKSVESNNIEDTFEHDADNKRIMDEKTIHVLLPGHAANKIGAIQNVFGGGNAAKVVGSTYVNIGTEYVAVSDVTVGTTDVSNYYTRTGAGTEASPYVYTKATGTAQTGITYYKPCAADIRGNVYGGGNAADVTGKTNVVIGQNE